MSTKYKLKNGWGSILKIKRKELGSEFTQKHFAKVKNVGEKTISRWERGELSSTNTLPLLRVLNTYGLVFNDIVDTENV